MRTSDTWDWDVRAKDEGDIVAPLQVGGIYQALAAQAHASFESFGLRQLIAGSVLEVGCGKGMWLRELKQHGFETFGGDRSPQMLRQAAAVAEVTQLDATALPFPDDSFDNALTVTVVQHLPDPVPAIAELTRVARRRVVIHEMTRSVVPRRFTPGTSPHPVSWYEQQFARYGWQLVGQYKTPRPAVRTAFAGLPRTRLAAHWLVRTAGLMASAHTWLAFEPADRRAA